MEQRLMDPPAAAVDRLSQLLPQFQNCIQNCLECFEDCQDLLDDLFEEENVSANLVQVLNDAIEITQTAASFMLRGSNFHIRTCAVCAEVCRVCAEECEKILSGNAGLIQQTIAALKSCSKSCYQMAHHH